MHGVRITPATMEAPELRDFYQVGRVAPYLMHIGLSCIVKLYVLYGWAAAEFKAERKASTCSLIQAICRDIELCRPSSKMDHVSLKKVSAPNIPHR